jgi:hypothetical protein
MNLKLLKFFLVNDEFFFERRVIEFEAGGDLPILRDQGNPALFLVSKDDATSLFRLTTSIECVLKKKRT